MARSTQVSKAQNTARANQRATGVTKQQPSDDITNTNAWNDYLLGFQDYQTRRNLGAKFPQQRAERSRSSIRQPTPPTPTRPLDRRGARAPERRARAGRAAHRRPAGTGRGTHRRAAGARLWTSLGNIPAQIAASNEAAQKLALQKQAGQLQAQQIQQGALTLQDAQAQHDADRQLSTMFANTHRNPDGTYDTRAFINNAPPELKKNTSKWVQQANAITDTWLADDARRRGNLQQAATGLYQAGAPFLATQGLIDSAHRDRLLSDDQAAQYKTLIV